jgi:DDE domain
MDRRLRSKLKPTNDSWRVDETYIRVKGKWVYFFYTARWIPQVVEWPFCCTSSFWVCSRRRTNFPIIYPDFQLDYKVP